MDLSKYFDILNTHKVGGSFLNSPHVTICFGFIYYLILSFWEFLALVKKYKKKYNNFSKISLKILKFLQIFDLKKANINMHQTKPNLLLLINEVPYQDNPTKVFQALCDKRPSTFLLESAEIQSKAGLKSFLIVDSALRISAVGQKVKVEALSVNGASLLPLLDLALPVNIINQASENLRTIIFPDVKNEQITDEETRLKMHSVFDVLRSLLILVNCENEPNEAFFVGGLFAYDLINNFEELPKTTKKNRCPDLCFYLAETLLILDHQEKNARFQTSLFTPNNKEKERINNRLLELKKLLNDIKKSSKTASLPTITQSDYDKVCCDQSDSEFANTVTKLQQHIENGEIFQVVPSRTFSLSCDNPLVAYNNLKQNNPSPYMFYMQDEDFTLFGASPESALKYSEQTRIVEIYPIAGTRPRGLNADGFIDHDLDSRLELDMRTDAKELAEHIMLIDLARNDIARISVAGTRYVCDLMNVDKYSQVMHLVSRVVGKLKPDLDALYAYQACMNMGTLSGAPKVRAMQLISEVERTSRGSYGGAIGYFTAKGNFDTCIVIRAAYVEDEIAYIQAGAGVVHASNPKSEADETTSKARAVLKAILQTHLMKQEI